MSDVNAIAGNLTRYQTMANGSLRITVDLPETETQHFHELFPAVHCEVALAPLRPTQMAASQPERPFGEYAKALRGSNFFSHREVWEATGSDGKFLAFVRTRKCIARSGTPCDGPIQAAHVWRGKDGFGKGIKGEYAAVALCAGHHRAQHQYGEDAIGGRDYMESKRFDTVVEWVWFEIKKDLGVDSMANAAPIRVVVWATDRQIAQFLPEIYKNAA